MKPLEEELKSALERREAPAGFTERVMAQIAATPQRPRVWRATLASLFRYPRLRWAATVVAAFLIVAGVSLVRRHEERLRGETARRELLFALRFAGNKLNATMREARSIERRNSETPEESQ